MIANLNDGSAREPYLRLDINRSNVSTLPPYSRGPHGDERALLEGIREAGYEGVQVGFGGDPALCRELGLDVTAGGRIDRPEDASPLAERWRDAGAECVTLHVGSGMETDEEMDRLVESVLDASGRHRIPLYVETHRATVTQDQWRTVRMVARVPGVRFNGDFSHWYTGQEMPYGDFGAKLDFLGPVFERVRFMHGRIGNGSHIQVDVGDGEGNPHVERFREMWTRSMLGFLRSAGPGDCLVFAPELLHPEIDYARVFPGPGGEPVEESDRWEQAGVLARVARECFAAAHERLEGGPAS